MAGRAVLGDGDGVSEKEVRHMFMLPWMLIPGIRDLTKNPDDCITSFDAEMDIPPRVGREGIDVLKYYGRVRNLRP